MKLSKLDLHIEILKTIDQRRLPQLTIAQDGANVNLDQLREQIDFLMKQGLVYQRKTRNQVAFKNTQRGISVLNYFENRRRTTVGEATL